MAASKSSQIIPLRVNFGSAFGPISAETQARVILATLESQARSIGNGKRQVALTFACNGDDAMAADSTYTQPEGGVKTGITGVGHAEVISVLEGALPLDDIIVHILPISINTYRSVYAERQILFDLCNIACHIGAGVPVIGWQNQHSVTRNKTTIGLGPFAIGGVGGEELSSEHAKFIQAILVAFYNGWKCEESSDIKNFFSLDKLLEPMVGGERDYLIPKLEIDLPSDWIQELRAAFQMGQEKKAPLFYLKENIDAIAMDRARTRTCCALM